MLLSLAARAGGLVVMTTILITSGAGAPRESAAQVSGPWVAPDSEKAKKNPLPSDKTTAERGDGAPASDGVGGSGGAKPPG